MITRGTPPPTHHPEPPLNAGVGGYNKALLEDYCFLVDAILPDGYGIIGGMLKRYGWLLMVNGGLFTNDDVNEQIKTTLKARSVVSSIGVIAIDRPEGFVLEGEFEVIEPNQDKCVSLVDLMDTIDRWRYGQKWTR